MQYFAYFCSLCDTFALVFPIVVPCSLGFAQIQIFNISQEHDLTNNHNVRELGNHLQMSPVLSRIPNSRWILRTHATAHRGVSLYLSAVRAGIHDEKPLWRTYEQTSQSQALFLQGVWKKLQRQAKCHVTPESMCKKTGPGPFRVGIGRHNRVSWSRQVWRFNQNHTWQR